MTNDIGTFKAVVPSGQVQVQAPHPTGRPQEDAQANKDPNAVRGGTAPPKDTEPLEEVVSEMNNLVRDMHRELQFSVDTDSGDTVIKVIDRETDEVVRQIPSEELMHLRKRLQEAAGVIFQDSA